MQTNERLSNIQLLSCLKPILKDEKSEDGYYIVDINHIPGIGTNFKGNGKAAVDFDYDILKIHSIVYFRDMIPENYPVNDTSYPDQFENQHITNALLNTYTKNYENTGIILLRVYGIISFGRILILKPCQNKNEQAIITPYF